MSKIREHDGAATADPTEYDPNNGSIIADDGFRKPTEYIVTTHFGATLRRCATLAAYRGGISVATRTVPSLGVTAGAFSAYAQTGQQFGMSVVSIPPEVDSAGTSRARPSRDGATVSGHLLVPNSSAAQSAAFQANTDLWVALISMGAGTLESFESATELLLDRWGHVFMREYIVGPGLDGTQPFLSGDGGLNDALRTLDVKYDSLAAQRFAIALYRSDAHAFKSPLWHISDDASPVVKGYDLKTDLGKRMAEVAARTHVHLSVGIYARQIARLAVELWDPIYQTLAQSSAPADEDALKTWNYIAAQYRAHIPLHPALGLLPTGRPKCVSPEGEGSAFVIPGCESDDLSSLLSGALRRPDEDPNRNIFTWRLAPDLAYLQGSGVSGSLAVLYEDAAAMDIIERERPGLLAYVRAQLPFDRPAAPLEMPTIQLDRYTGAWVSEAGTSVPVDHVLRGETPLMATASSGARPYRPEMQNPGPAAVAVIPLDREYTLVRPSTNLAYVGGSFEPPRVRPTHAQLGWSSHYAMTFSAAVQALRRTRIGLSEQTAAANVLLAIGPTRQLPNGSTAITPDTLVSNVFAEPVALGSPGQPAVDTYSRLEYGLASNENGYYVGVASRPTTSLVLGPDVPAVSTQGNELAQTTIRFVVAEAATNYPPLATHVPLTFDACEPAMTSAVGARRYIIVRGISAMALLTTRQSERRASRAHPATTFTAEARASDILNRFLTFIDVGGPVDAPPGHLGGG